ncbi:hypothetical protein SynPROS71_02837 [Synechococcus sp. PROS-7-1]|nr:hypothetical protein SynPROS71_02837 [Synechococcus sp. PROS-7-1]
MAATGSRALTRIKEAPAKAPEIVVRDCENAIVDTSAATECPA